MFALLAVETEPFFSELVSFLDGEFVDIDFVVVVDSCGACPERCSLLVPFLKSIDASVYSLCLFLLEEVEDPFISIFRHWMDLHKVVPDTPW